MKDLHLVMPMGGKGERFFKDGFELPKPLIEINGRPFFYWSAMSVLKYLPDCDVSFVVLAEHIEKFGIDKKILSYFPSARIVVLESVLRGAVLTCMRGVEGIGPDKPVIFNDCDHMFKCSGLYELNEEEDPVHDGFLLTFRSDSPKYSYAETDDEGFVIRTVEKEVISDQAICGAYYFRNKDIFLDNAAQYLEKCSYSEFFMSGVYNCMADNGLHSGILMTDYHVSFGTPEEYYDAQNRKEFSDLL